MKQTTIVFSIIGAVGLGWLALNPIHTGLYTEVYDAPNSHAPREILCERLTGECYWWSGHGTWGYFITPATIDRI